jgi:NAD(P)-dependent dehydrogenase (short-subunit alcohol dehydrogenase family)
MNKLDLQGRCAVVTGGASGIGEATIRRMAESGANVAIWDVNEKAMSEIAQSIKGVKTHFCKVDVSSLEQVEAAFKSTVAAFGKVDALVNSAGVAGVNTNVWEYPVKEWQRVLDINLTGTFYTCRTVTPHMMENKYGRIVNMSSVAGKEGNPTASAYSAAKAGVIALTRSLGKELATDGVLVNAVTPTTVNTPILEQVSQAHIEYMKSKIPMGRLGEAEELAALITWLCTEDCSFSTAAVFDASGGRTTY